MPDTRDNKIISPAHQGTEIAAAPNRKAVLNMLGSQEFRRLQEFYKYKSSWEILGISRRELSHSNFLAWLLNPQESHDLGYFALKRLFQCLVFALESDNNSLENIKAFSGLGENFDDFLNAVSVGDILFDDIVINREYDIERGQGKGTGKGNSLDILIEGTIRWSETAEKTDADKKSSIEKKLLLVIENKVDSKEGVKQTDKYCTWVEGKKTVDNLPIMIFLKTSAAQNARNVKFINLDYQLLLERLLQPALDKTDSVYTRTLLEDYIRNLSCPAEVFRKDGKSDNKMSIMATPKDEQDLLDNFINRHKEFITGMIYVRYNDSEEQLIDSLFKSNEALFRRVFNRIHLWGNDFSDNEKNMAGDLSRQKGERDTTKYMVMSGQSETLQERGTKIATALCVIKKIIEENPDLIMKLNKYGKSRGRLLGKTIIKDNQQAGIKQDYYGPFKDYYIIGKQWTRERLDSLIDFVEKEYNNKVSPDKTIVISAVG